MRSATLLCALLTALMLLATGCGDNGDDGSRGSAARQDGGGGSRGATDTDHGGSGSETRDGGDETGGGEDDPEDSESEFAVETELDLGQAFAEEPMFDGALGPAAVSVRTDRGGGANDQVPITFRLSNSGEATLADASFSIRFTVLPGKDPEDPPVPDPGDAVLALSPQTTAGSCVVEEASSSTATLACALGTLSPDQEATVTVTSPQWFRFSVGMELTAQAR
jgi:hypothetical protein